jgi:hypothetical protein
MKAKEKALELIEKMFSNMPKYLQGKIGSETAKQSALICVDEFIDALSFNSSPTAEGLTEFYEKVKEEINKL